MVSRAFQTWAAKGRPWKLARPVMELNNWAADNGVKVKGTIGNDGHLERDRPEDHTPFSSTPWPVALNDYWVCAIDLDNVNGLGAAIERKATAGQYPWIKYMNHSHRHISFMGRVPAVSYSDDEHVHISVRSDWVDRGIGFFAPWLEDDDVKSEDIKAIADAVVRADIDYSDKGTQSFGGGVFTAMLRLANIQMRMSVIEAKLDRLLAKSGGD